MVLAEGYGVLEWLGVDGKELFAGVGKAPHFGSLRSLIIGWWRPVTSHGLSRRSKREEMTLKTTNKAPSTRRVIILIAIIANDVTGQLRDPRRLRTSHRRSLMYRRAYAPWTQFCRMILSS